MAPLAGPLPRDFALMATPVQFRNRRGLELVGMMHGEMGDSAIILCHGMLSAKDGSKHELIAAALEARGLSSLRFDFAGRGDSEGSLFDLSYSNEVADLEAAIDFLTGRGVQTLGLFGSSMGGAVALMAAARDERVVAIATIAAVAHPAAVGERYPMEVEAWRKRGYIDTDAGCIGRDFYDDAVTHDVLAAVRILHAPLLVLHGDQDQVVPTSDAHDIASTARNASLEIVFGADHRFTNPIHLRPAITRICDFFVEHLGTTAGGNAHQRVG